VGTVQSAVRVTGGAATGTASVAVVVVSPVVTVTCVPLTHGTPTDCNVAMVSGSSQLTNQIVHVAWDWGDGLTEGTAVPIDAHSYAQSGTYTVQATLTLSGGVMGRGTASVVIP
jgi:hypothetical protein